MGKKSPAVFFNRYFDFFISKNEYVFAVRMHQAIKNGLTFVCYNRYIQTYVKLTHPMGMQKTTVKSKGVQRLISFLKKISTEIRFYIADGVM